MGWIKHNKFEFFRRERKIGEVRDEIRMNYQIPAITKEYVLRSGYQQTRLPDYFYQTKTSGKPQQASNIILSICFSSFKCELLNYFFRLYREVLYTDIQYREQFFHHEDV